MLGKINKNYKKKKEDKYKIKKWNKKNKEDNMKRKYKNNNKRRRRKHKNSQNRHLRINHSREVDLKISQNHGEFENNYIIYIFFQDH